MCSGKTKYFSFSMCVLNRLVDERLQAALRSTRVQHSQSLPYAMHGQSSCSPDMSLLYAVELCLSSSMSLTASMLNMSRLPSTAAHGDDISISGNAVQGHNSSQM